METLLERLVPTPGSPSGQAAALNTRSVIRDLHATDPTIAHLQGTGWGFLQAVCAYSDHRVPARGDAPDARFRRVVMEERPGLAARAASLALAELQGDPGRGRSGGVPVSRVRRPIPGWDEKSRVVSRGGQDTAGAVLPERLHGRWR